MPTYDAYEPFRRDFQRLTREQREAFMSAVEKLVEDLRRGVFRKGLRIKRVQTHEGVWEMTWAPDGRATFEYGQSVRPGDHHVIWRRIGSHEIFDNP
jgi:hypothetical protein